MRTNRGQHPDLTDDGELLADVDVPASQRDHNRRMLDDAERGNFTERLARWQSSLPVEVQQMVQGRQYASTEHYQQAVQRAMAEYGHAQGTPLMFTDADIERMSLAEYDAFFDAGGRPKAGVGVWYQRAVKLDSRSPR